MVNKKHYWIGIVILIVFAAFLLISRNSPDTIQSQSTMPTSHHMHMAIISEEQFIAEMIPHHQEAVDTSKVILAKSNNNDLKNLAEEIVDAQTREIEMLNSWKKEFYPNSIYQSIYLPMMPNLQDLKSPELDNTFIQGMIMHHMMAIMMAEQVLSLNPRPEIKQFAEQVIEVQSKEIKQMQAMLVN